MANQDPIEKMLQPALSALAAVGQVVSGAGEEARSAHREVEASARGMLSAGERAAEAIRKGRAEEAVRFEGDDARRLRLHKEGLVMGAAQKLIANGNDAMQKSLAHYESVLETGSLPAPAKDAATRMLVRDELRTRYGRFDADRLHATLLRRLGEEPSHDAEILSSYGKDFLLDRGLTEDQIAGLRSHALTKYLSSSSGTSVQLGARKALAAYRETNLKGNLVGFREAGRQHLNNVDTVFTPSPTATGAATGRALRG